MVRRIRCLLLLTIGVAVTGTALADTAPGPVAAVRAPADTGQPQVARDVDRMLQAEWRRHRVTPAPRVDDARYLRRIYLDITGTIPTADAVRAFLADRAPDRRVRAVDALLDSPAYVSHWTDYWDGILMGRQLRNPVVDRVAFRQWLQDAFARNTPWDKLVYDLLTATGVNSEGGSIARAAGLMAPGDRKAGAMDAVDRDSADRRVAVNGAVNWFLKYAQTPADLAGNASKLFLGVQIQCAQCHDHKTEKWKQDDFRRFAACFIQARPVPVGNMKEKGVLRRLELRDVSRPTFAGRRLAARNEYAAAVPTALDGTDFSNSPNRRQALAAWITAPQNPWFAQAIVNRMWAQLLGRGFVDPIDDFRPGNPAVMPAVLKRLTDDFVASGYDLKRLLRTICATRAYQLAPAPARPGDPDNRLWSRGRLKPLAPEELLDSLVTATNLQPVLERVAGRNLEQLRFAMRRQFTFLFDTDEETEQKEFEGTIPQALLLLNGNLVNRGTTPIPGTAIAETLAMAGSGADRIQELYLRTLSRPPSAAELRRWTQYVGADREPVAPGPEPAVMGRPRALPAAGKRARGNAPDPLARLRLRNAGPPTAKQQAYEDLMWALLNSSEFAFNH